MNKLFLSASLMCGDPLNLKREINILQKNRIDYLHIDVMDGSFVPNIALGFGLANSLAQLSVPRDIHLMVTNPAFAVKKLILKKSDIVFFHLESNVDKNDLISFIKIRCHVGLAVNPQTPIEKLYSYLRKIDYVYLMTIINPGFEGQPFDEQSYERAEKLCLYIKRRNYKTIVGVDGAVGLEQIETFSRYGVRLFVLGTKAIYKGDIDKNLKKLNIFIQKL